MICSKEEATVSRPTFHKYLQTTASRISQIHKLVHQSIPYRENVFFLSLFVDGKQFGKLILWGTKNSLILKIMGNDIMEPNMYIILWNETRFQVGRNIPVILRMLYIHRIQMRLNSFFLFLASVILNSTNLLIKLCIICTCIVV